MASRVRPRSRWVVIECPTYMGLLKSFFRSRSRHASGVAQVQLDRELDAIDGVDIVAKSIVETTSIMADPGDNLACPRCRGKVFEAERMNTSNGVTFHRKCFTCEECHRALDPAGACDGERFGELLCKNCYGKRFGPAALKVCDPVTVMEGFDVAR